MNSTHSAQETSPEACPHVSTIKRILTKFYMNAMPLEGTPHQSRLFHIIGKNNMTFLK
jgi:hypothetical protein